MRLTFHGVRGSCPCPSEDNRRYGGNTACIALDEPGEEPILFDLGTGLRLYAETLDAAVPFSGTALVTHIHWDHVQGLPFFPPVHRPGSRLEIYGPHQVEGPLGEVFGDLMRPPYFPVHFSELGGDITFRDVTEDVFAIGHRKVTVRSVPHVGATVGYRVEGPSGKVAYISDHQAPADLEGIAPGVLELCEGVDVLVHDAQYTPEEFQEKITWGHCTMDYALHVAARCNVRTLVLFHHDPAHDDDALDRHGAEMRAKGEALGVQVLTAAEGMVLDVVDGTTGFTGGVRVLG